MLRRVRALATVAILWSLAFGVIGGLIGGGIALLVAQGVLPPARNPHAHLALLLVVSRAARWAAIGALGGMTFAAMLRFAERHKVIADLDAARVARWGFLAGVLGATMMVVAVLGFGIAAAIRGEHRVEVLWMLLLTQASVPLIGGLLGRVTARTILRTARRIPSP